MKTRYDHEFIPWKSLSNEQREFLDNEGLPLPINHQEQISMLKGIHARTLIKEQLMLLPKYSRCCDVYHLHNTNSEKESKKVKKWLFNKKIPFSTEVFLLYDNMVIRTTWKIVVYYWDAFACSVGLQMELIDGSTQWFFEFDHEDAIRFFDFR